MEIIYNIIKKYRKNGAYVTLINEICYLLSIFLCVFIIALFIESIYYLDPVIKNRLFAFYISIISIGFAYILLKCIISIYGLFNYKNELQIAKEIWIQNKNIKDTLLNVIQINKIKDEDNEDLKKYAVKSLNKKITRYLQPYLQYQYPKKSNMLLYVLVK